jgi:hypothetical protein
VTLNYILPGNLFTDATFQTIVIQPFLEKHREDEIPPRIDCSPRFIRGFKDQNNFASRRAHLKRRPHVSTEERETWLTRLEQLLREVPDHTRIINVDESCRQVEPGALRTWTIRVTQNVALRLNGNQKDSFIVVAAITAARTKLPPCMIAAGKTDRVEASHFGDVGYHRTAHSESGWQTSETFTQWLSWLRGLYDDGAPIWLILNCSAVHRQDAMRQFAQDLGTNLVFIPRGLTDEFEPLDHFVFGAMKATCRRLYGLHCEWNPGEKMDHQIAAAFLIRAWEAVTAEVLENAWALCETEQSPNEERKFKLNRKSTVSESVQSKFQFIKQSIIDR